MPVSVITFANLGKKANFATADILPVIKAFSAKHSLVQVICERHAGFPIPHTVSALPDIVHYPVRAMERLFPRFISRRQIESLFDYFAARKLARAAAHLFHGGFLLPRTFVAARAQGSITIDLPRNAHFCATVALEREELGYLGIHDYSGIYGGLCAESAHCIEFDYVIAISDYVKQSYVMAGYPVNQIFTAHPDIDTQRFSPISVMEPRPFRVLYVGYTTPLKGLHYLFDAWKTLGLAEAELVLVGGYGDMPDQLRRQYDACIDADPSIRRVASTTAPEALYRTADILVFPSLAEGFGRVTLEAMACGIPVITTEHARGIVEDGVTGFVVPIRSADALAERIRYCYEHRDATREMGLEARRAVERKPSFGAAVYDIYQEILAAEKKL